ncbi:MAG: DUF1761 domain-containing protein [Candidatus Uhrbacteria bacterium]|nr:DUF1761 domain-containing protein [Candidatus Uhrbacteria bacterium]
MNLYAIFVAAATMFVIGFLMHGPLFGKTWMKLANVHPTGKEKLSDMIPQMTWNFIANLVAAFVLAGVLWMAFSSQAMGEIAWYKGLIVAAWMWIGFIVTSSSNEVIWMKRNIKLWLFECGSTLLQLGAMGIILSIWK